MNLQALSTGHNTDAIRPGYGRATVPVGMDCGNANFKAVFGDEAVILPSYLASYGLSEDGRISGLVEYNGLKFLTGEMAINSGLIRVCDDRDRKAEYALPLLFGALAKLPYRPSWDLHVIASAHNNALRKQIQETLAGTYCVTLNNCDRSTVTIKVLGTMAEGVPASIYSAGLTGILDIGGGTSQVLLAQAGKQIAPTTQFGGIDWIVCRIDATLKKQGLQASRASIRSAIDDQSYIVGTLETTGIAPLFQAELSAWAKAELAPCISQLRGYSGLSKMLAIGGGVKIPAIRALLQKYAIEIPESPELIGARAMASIAASRI